MAKKSLDVVVVGELNIDLVLKDVPMPEYEKEKLAREMSFTMGSSSAITAFNLSALGGKTGFFGKIGDDLFGDFMVRCLDQGGVDANHIIRDNTLKTGATIVLANPPQKALLTYLGAMTHLTLEDIEWEYINQARHLHLGCYYLQTGIKPDVSALFKRAKELGLTTSLDTNWDPTEKWGDELSLVLRYTDIFLPNDSEAIQMAHTDNLDEAVQILGKKVPVLAVKRGEKGGLVCVNGKTMVHPGFKVNVVETTGAGDSFNSGFLYRYLQGASWADCLCFANACGAIAVTEIGGTQAFQNRESLHLRLKRMLENE